MTYNCPNCGAELTFKSKLSVYTTCTYCTSMVVRHDLDVELIGKQGALLEDMSPFQVGTQGKYEDKTFEMLGRIKLIWSAGTWSEWFVMFEDGTEGWLAEAQGFYMMSFKVELTGKLHPPNKMEVGKEYMILGEQFLADDIKKIKYLASEGELPFAFKKGFTGLSVDLRGKNKKFASILHTPLETEVFIGKYAPFHTFEFTNLRKIDGWD